MERSDLESSFRNYSLSTDTNDVLYSRDSRIQQWSTEYTTERKTDIQPRRRRRTFHIEASQITDWKNGRQKLRRRTIFYLLSCRVSLSRSSLLKKTSHSVASLKRQWERKSRSFGIDASIMEMFMEANVLLSCHLENEDSFWITIFKTDILPSFTSKRMSLFRTRFFKSFVSFLLTDLCSWSWKRMPMYFN